MVCLKYRKGVSLLEGLFVLGVMLIIIGIVITYLFISRINLQDNRLNSEMILLFKLCDDELSAHPTIEPTINELITGNGIPNSFISNNQLITPYGTSITLGETSSKNFGFTLSDIQKTTCISIVTSWNNISELMINGSSSTDRLTLLSKCTNSSTVIYVVSDIVLGSSSSEGSSTSSTGSSSDSSTPLTDDENDLAKLMKEQMEEAALARETYNNAVAAANADQAQAEKDASAGDYDAMNQEYNKMNQERDIQNKALDDWNKTLDLGNAINAEEQKIYANNGQSQSETNSDITTAAKSVNYTDPTPSGI